MNDSIHELICEFKSAEAFWAAAKNVLTDKYSQKMFLNIANQRNHIVHLLKDIDKIQELAEKGNPYMQYALARLHETLALEANSNEICEKNYEAALQAGIADAGAQLAFMYRDADLGEVDIRRFRSLMDQALENDSTRAVQFRLHETIFGSDYVDADEEKAIGLLDEYLKNTPEEEDPYYFRLRAVAKERLGRKEEAEEDYKKAIELGDSESFFLLASLKCCDDQGNVVDMETFMELMEKGQEAGAPSAYLETACLMTSEYYEGMDEETRTQVRDILKEDLALGASLGESYAAYFMGSYFENGDYGFEQDFGQAWQWYSKGALLRNSSCYQSLSRMVLEDKTAPENYDEAFGYECAYRAYALKADTLESIISGYKKGFLTHHAAVIEEFYLPIYESLTADENEPEIEEDCFSEYDDPDIVVAEYKNESEDNLEELENICRSCLEQAQEAMQEYTAPWKIGELAREYADAADRLKEYEHLLNTLYSLNDKMLDLICDHPRLKLRLSHIQLEVLGWIEAKSRHDLSIREDLEKEARELERCIELADQNRLDEIPQKDLLKRDPVEWTKHWEQVIDRADQMAYEKLSDIPHGMGWCFAFWSERKAALRQLGIDWKDPHQMNPGVIFD